jgi:hypothetical protein
MFFFLRSVVNKLKPLQFCVFLFLVTQYSSNSYSSEEHSNVSQRDGYSSLGLGFELLNFEESISLYEANSSGDILNIEIDSDYSGGNFAQRSWVFVSVDELWGFYIGSGSTLSSIRHNETWKTTITNEAKAKLYSDLTIQTNTTTLSRNELSVLAVRAVSGNHSFLFGGRYNSVTYKRFDFKAHASSVFPNLILPEGDISEESTAFIGQVGYEYNEFFTSKEPGWRTQFRSVLGLVIYNRVQNTANQLSKITFDDTFNGYDLKATISFGYQFSENFMLATALDTHYQSYQEIKQDNAAIPDNVFSYIQPSINALWSF